MTFLRRGIHIPTPRFCEARTAKYNKQRTTESKMHHKGKLNISN